MDLKNSNYKVISNEGVKCGFCSKNLKPIGFDYLYVNYDKSMIEYERCNCEKAVQFWKQFDLEQEEKQRQEEYKKIINSIYKDNYMKKRLQKYNFENVSDTYEDTFIINQLIKFTDLCIESEIKNSIAVIADLTGNRGGVYYEAGIARGLQLCNHPLKLILTCQKDFFDKKSVHFDLRGNNIVIYQDIKDLKEKLSDKLKNILTKQ